jgi:tRNA nucleotidyltransferase (CCA-adding enzyme)
LHAIEDPFGGRSDLQARVLRHTSDAFTEDPVRILRVARFAARFPDFSVAEATLALMRSMVDGGEVQHLVPERIWQELAKGLMTQRPARMLEVLRSCGALRAVLPEVDALWGVPQSPEHHPEVDTGVHLGLVLDAAAAAGAPLAVRFACLGHDLGKAGTDPAQWPRHIGHVGRGVRALQALCKRLRVPQACAELAEVVAREHGNVHRSADLGPEAVLRLLERCDAFRKPARFADVLLACQCDARGRLGRSHDAYPQALRLSAALQAARSVDSAGVAEAAMAAGAKGPEVGLALARARVQAISQALC